MSKSKNTTKQYPRVTLDCRISCTHPYFRGDGYTAQVFCQLATMQAFEECEKRLSNRSNMVKLKRTQVLTSVRTLAGLTGFTKHRVEKALKRLVELNLIQREKCEERPKLSRNDGEVVTVLRLAGCPSVPDTSTTTKSDVISTNTNSNTSRTKKFTPPTYDEVLAYAEKKSWPDAKNLADRFFEYYDGTGWIKEKVGKPVRNWKLTMCDWQDRQGDRQSIKVVSDSRVVRHEGFRKLTYEEAMLKNDMEASTSAA